MVVVLLAVALLVGGWAALRPELTPTWIWGLTAGAVLLRMSAGIFWYSALPVWGHGSEAETAGYVMSDAYFRDTTAWELAQSDKQLSAAFQEYRLADQYGGLLFISSGIYRWFGGGVHTPLLVVVLTAAFSGLSIPFVWVFTRKLWGDAAAKAASWILFLYPEAVLLGSTQMREPFLMTLTCVVMYGLLVLWQDRKWIGILWVVGGTIACLPISSLYAVFLSVFTLAMALILSRFQIMRNWRMWLILAVLVLIGLLSLSLLGERVYPNEATNPLIFLRDWLTFAARWEERTATITSGWMDKILQNSPEWMNSWIILGYGAVQPFLPAALIATGNPLWRGIAIWRSVGWTFLFVLIFYAPVRGLITVRKQYFPVGLSMLVWVVILISAYRGGGDQWDNPRYRMVFAGLQSALAGWVLVEQSRNPNPWFRRVLIGMGLVFLWFIPWYLRRYYASFTWPVIDLFKTITLGIISALLFWIWDWVRCEEVDTMDDLSG
jgi:hypothetical protein